MLILVEIKDKIVLIIKVAFFAFVLIATGKTCCLYKHGWW